MKLKRFLALSVAMIMVLAMVPAMSVSAATSIPAAGDTVVINGVTYEYAAENLVEDGGFDDGNGNFSWGTWFSPNGSNGPFANNCQDWFYKVNRDTNQAVLYTKSLTASDYALGTRWNDGSTGLCSLANNIPVEAGKTYRIAFDYKHKSANEDTGYQWVSFVTTATASTDGSNKIVNVPAAQTTWQTAEAVFTPETDGYVFFHFRWLGDGSNNSGNGPFWYYDNFIVQEIKEASASSESSIKGALDALTLPKATKTGVTLPATATDSIGTTVDVTWTSSNPDVLGNDGAVVASPAGAAVVEMTPSAAFNNATVTGEAVSVTVFPASAAGTEWSSGEGVYNIGTENIIAAAGTAASFEDEYGNQSLAGWKSHLGGDAHTAMNWGDAADDVVPDGNWAYIGWWNDPITHASNYCTLDTMWAVEAGTYYLSFWAKKQAGGSSTYVYFSEDDAHHTAESQLTAEKWNEKVLISGDWAKYEYVITADTAGYIGFTSWNIGNNGSRGTWFDDFELYTAEAVAETVTGIETPDNVKVIEGTTPVLPAEVAGIGSLGSHIPTAVVWDTTGLDFSTAGNVVVPGTAAGMATTITVEVLEETFALADMTLPSEVVFPVNLAGEFSIEYVLNASNLDNVWMYISKDKALWGAGQIGIGLDNAGTGYINFQPQGNTSTQLTADKDYRFFITGNAATDTYSATLIDVEANAIMAEVEGYGFRSTADYINSINFTANNENGVATLKNIKVNAPEAIKVEYTVNTTINDEAQASTTIKAFNEADALSQIADIAGYEKTVSVEGTVITVIYTSTYTASVSFKNAAGVEVYAVSQVIPKDETITVEAREVFVLDSNYVGTLYAIPETVVNATGMEVEVAEVANKYVVLEDALVSDNEIWGIKATNSNSVFVAGGADDNQAPTSDANGEHTYGGANVPGVLGKSRVGFFQFPVVDVTEGQTIEAVFPVRSLHKNGFDNGNPSLRFALTAINDDSWTTLTDGGSYNSANAPVFENWNTPVFSEKVYNYQMEGNNNGERPAVAGTELRFDVTEIMIAAKAAGLSTITFRLNAPYGAAYIAEREAAVIGGKYEGQVSYLTVTEPTIVRAKVEATGAATLTKNGSVMNGYAYVVATDDIRLNADGAVVVNTDAGYYPANEAMHFAADVTFANTAPAKLGLEMVNGAQVRIGSTELADGEKLDALADSGIRFIATADYSDTVIADDANVTFGIQVQAEGSEVVLDIPAVNFQNDEKTAFTAAITKLATSNYNRKYTACAYAKVPMADGSDRYFTTSSVARSVYQVSAGIMKNGSADGTNADGTNAPYTVDGTVKNILNAYVNQVGIRLNYNAAGEMTASNVYTGDVFFTVETSPIEGGVHVTITPSADWGTPAEIAEWWQDYVRVNNNNSISKTYMSNAEIVEGVLSFDFVPTANN